MSESKELTEFMNLVYAALREGGFSPGKIKGNALSIGTPNDLPLVQKLILKVKHDTLEAKAHNQMHRGNERIEIRPEAKIEVTDDIYGLKNQLKQGFKIPVGKQFRRRPFK